MGEKKRNSNRSCYIIHTYVYVQCVDGGSPAVPLPGSFLDSAREQPTPRSHGTTVLCFLTLNPLLNIGVRNDNTKTVKRVSAAAALVHIIIVQ